MSDPAALALKSILDAAMPDDVVRKVPMVVQSTREDGRVNLAWGETVFDGVACSSAYVNRQAGDVVTVEITSAGWLVQPPAGPEPAALQVDTTVTRWGTGAPTGSGWQKATAVWVRDGEVYAQLDAPPTVPPSQPTRSPTVTIQPVSDALYSGGRRYSAYNGGHPAQGGYGNYAGAWFYGSKFADAIGSRTVASIKVRVVRRASGQSVSIKPQFYLHDAAGSTYALPNLHDHWTPDKGLSRGEGYTYTLPGFMVSQLTSGPAKGLGVRASGGYLLLFAAGSGDTTITFD